MAPVRPKRSRTTRRLASQSAAPSMAAHRGAATGRDDHYFTQWHPGLGSADADLLSDLPNLTARSRDLGRNNGLMAGAMQTQRDNIVGSVLRLSASPEYRLLGITREQAREWGNTVEPRFRSWGDTTECDAQRTSTLLGIAHQALTGSMLNGDAIVLPLWLPRRDSRWSTRLLVVESDRLSTPPWMAANPSVRAGIETDQYGAPVAYHIQRYHPGDLCGSYAVHTGGFQQWERIPAFTAWGRRRVIHLHDKDRTGQSRGKPLVSAVIRDFKMAGDYSSNELQASVANSLVAAFLESDLSQEASQSLFGEKPRDEWNTSVDEARGSLQSLRHLKPGAIIPLPVGARLSSYSPGRPNAAFEAFMLAVLRHIAAGMNMSYELLLKDFSKTNYSSARATLLEVWRYFSGRRRWLTDVLLRPVYELWLEEAVNAGEVEAPGFYQNAYAYSRCRFIFGGRGWVDPVKEAQASVLRMNAGLTTLEQECAEQGADYEEVLDQLAIEKSMKEARGLSTEPVSAARRSGLSASEAPLAGDEKEEGAAGA
ncbi:phage portal protein [Alicycliphilus denitrificans]|uniref:phage portal protein n=1 Tax=Alicycliphilus denitrificans TaxID=179636 RepID=UPI0001DA0B44|nr:phage portal protein [Alicycliphilus denitrificans]ADV01268.1 phage portal protein, lambda family [Alicycliphilus denitrificans BC]